MKPEFGMENLLASRLVSRSKLPWKLTKRFRYLSFWNVELGVCLFSGLNNSKFSLNPLLGIPPRAPALIDWNMKSVPGKRNSK